MAEAAAARFFSEGAPSVSQLPLGMKQNCSEPDSLTVRKMLDSTSLSAAAAAARECAGFSIIFFGDPAKDATPARG
jgi:hypothetical protein